MISFPSWAQVALQVLVIMQPRAVADTAPIDLVDTQIGTAAGGHVFAGATMPYGMAKPVGDAWTDKEGGFAYDGIEITGFSHMHDSGTGGGSSLGNFPLFPHSGCVNDVPDGCAPFTKAERRVKFDTSTISASPGYWSIKINSSIQTEVTATDHAALYRFTFPKTPVEKNATLSPFILLDLTDLYDSGSYGLVTVDEKAGRITARGSYAPSFGTGMYESYACADFAGAAIVGSGVWKGSKTSNKKELETYGKNDPGGAWMQFAAPDAHIMVRVGVSLINTAQACRNAEKEIPDFATAFESVHKAARKAWEKQLSPVKVDATGVSMSLQRTFWSGIYRTMISPQNYTGENPDWNSTEPYFDSFYCIWDIFRATHPLLIVLDPINITLMVRSLIDIYKHTGYLPDCRMALSPGYTQGGSNAEVVLADSYVKSIGNYSSTADTVDWETAFEAMVKDAEEEPYAWLTAGRGHLQNYKGIGYIPIDDPNVGNGLHGGYISRTVEYAYDDFCIAEMARVMGKTTEHQIYSARAENWRNMLNVDQTSTLAGKDTGIKGFLQPRWSNGSFGYQDPTLASPANNENCCGMFSADVATYEGAVWLYTLYAPGNMAGLIDMLGGASKFVERLDYTHANKLVSIGNEQSFLTVYLYHYAGRPGRSTYQAHYYMSKYFKDTPDGLPGNDDSGAMGSFEAWTMLGLFPNAGQNVYLITTPFFPSVSITSPLTHNTATIKCVNFDPTYKNIYIQSAKLDGKTYTKSWVDHGFFLHGSVLELTLGSTESETWGTGFEDLPPSTSPVNIRSADSK